MIQKINKDKWVGTKIRYIPESNYFAIWHNLRTVRMDIGPLKELNPSQSEFYDVSLGTLCANGNCDFCYVGAGPHGREYDNVCKTWKNWMSTFPPDKYNDNDDCITAKPFQIAIGSQGDPCDAVSLPKFLKTVYETNVVPNYTTNGIALSYWNSTLSPSKKHRAREILAATAKYCGGVAVSMGDGSLSADRIEQALNAVLGLHDHGDCHIIMHHIISDKRSVDQFIWLKSIYGNLIRTHVLLPMVAAGRSTQSIEEGVFDYLQDTLERTGINNVAFGAHFIDALKGSRLKTWLYPAETYSKNVLLQDGKVVITRSSFDLKPIKIIKV